jgi:hypothetical protein
MNSTRAALAATFALSLIILVAGAHADTGKPAKPQEKCFCY